MDFLADLNQFIDDFLQSPPLDNILLWVKPIAGVVCLVLAVNIFFLIKKTDYFWFLKYRLESFDDEGLVKRAEKKWAEIEKKLLFNDEANLKMAVIEADNFMDEVLKKMSLPGDDMGGRLKNLDVSKLQSVNSVWDAHKLRNMIVHDSDYKIRSDEAKRAVGGFKKALQELQLL